MEIFSISGRQAAARTDVLSQEAASAPKISPEAPPKPGGVGPAPEDATIPTEEIVAQLQEYIDRMNVSIAFTPYGANKERMSIAVIDKDTGKTIREIPAEELQRLYMKMQEVAGMIFSETA